MNQTMQDKITAHYNHAKEKHPYFCDMITQLGKDDMPVIQAVIENRRWQIETYPHNGNGELYVYPKIKLQANLHRGDVIRDDGSVTSVEEASEMQDILEEFNMTQKGKAGWLPHSRLRTSKTKG